MDIVCSILLDDFPTDCLHDWQHIMLFDKMDNYLGCHRIAK